MNRRFLILVAASVTCVLFVGLRLREFLYLQRGYDIGFSLAQAIAPGAPTFTSATSHVDFPLWRKVAQVITTLLALAAAGLLWERRRSAGVTAWLGAASVASIGISDVMEYGTLGSPTSIWSVLAALLLALLVNHRRGLERPLRSES